MDGKVGRMPDGATVTRLFDSVRGVVATWRPYGVILGTKERRELLHARHGAEPHIARIAEIAARYKVAIPDVPIDGMLDDLALWNLLRPFQDAFAKGLVLLDDTAAQADHEAWQAFLTYYGLLSGMAQHQPAVAADLAPTVAFMATGPREEKPAEEAAPPQAPPAPPGEPPRKRKARRAAGRNALQNRVGDQVPDAATRAKALSDLDEVVSTWSGYGLIHTGAQRRALHHPRHGAGPHVARIHDLAVKHAAELDGIPLQGMLDDLALSAALRPFQDELRGGLALVEDTASTAESECWEAFLAYYAALTGLAKHHPGVAADLKPIVEFMKNGPAGAPAAPQKG